MSSDVWRMTVKTSLGSSFIINLKLVINMRGPPRLRLDSFSSYFMDVLLHIRADLNEPQIKDD